MTSTDADCGRTLNGSFEYKIRYVNVGLRMKLWQRTIVDTFDGEKYLNKLHTL